MSVVVRQLFPVITPQGLTIIKGGGGEGGGRESRGERRREEGRGGEDGREGRRIKRKMWIRSGDSPVA